MILLSCRGASRSPLPLGGVDDSKASWHSITAYHTINADTMSSTKGMKRRENVRARMATASGDGDH